MNAINLEDLATAMAARRAQARMRIGLAASFVLCFGTFAGWPFVIGWFCLYAGLQALEHRLFANDDAMTPARARIALTLLVLNSATFGALGLHGPFPDGPWGVASGSLLLAGAILNTVTTNMASRAAFTAALAPFAVYIVAMAFAAVWVGATARHGLLLGFAGVMIVISAVMIWRTTARVYRAEVRARAESERRRSEAESAVAAKSAFMAVVSHELRTPISAILAGAAEIERTGEGATKGNARLIGDAGSMMTALLNDLLDMAKLDAGRLAVEQVSFDLRSLLADQMRFWRAQAKTKGLRLRFIGAAATPRLVAGDSLRIRQILNNLISNALKFTDHGSVTVRVGCTPGEAGTIALSVAVIDTGPGMSEDQVSRLFAPFEQLEASVARDHGGTGLGLAISRDLARLMGGDIDVTSTLGEGASFVLRLALQPGEASPSQVEPSAAPFSGGGVQVLVVDDHEINRRALTLMLEPAQVVVTCATSGADALTLLAVRTFDVVLMDCNMPGMDGRAATRILRGAPGPNRATPVIAITGSTSDQDVRECVAAGMNDHVAKPIDVADLHAALARALETQAPSERSSRTA
ncbi:MAG TPA: ATP-binding protein [Caulobacteraceae bacterium]|nr:ATP-binding protein [Caulobacteraceae bacterium]